MQAPAIPDNEAQRLRALRARAILDAPAEERFDRLTRLAQHMFGTQMALVSLVDAERQWFKSHQGLNACETGRDISFCGHAILADDIFEIADARLDPRFADNPLVSGPPHIRFYASAPLATADGYRIGTLCIIDDQPRQLSAEDRRARVCRNGQWTNGDVCSAKSRRVPHVPGCSREARRPFPTAHRGAAI